MDINSEAHEEQAELIDPTLFLTEQEIEARIDADSEFRMAVTSGKIDLTKGVLREAAQAPSQTEEATTSESIADDGDIGEVIEEPDTEVAAGKQAASEKQQPLVAKTPDGRTLEYKSVSQVLKSVGEKEAFIEKLLPLKERNSELEAQIKELQERVKQKEEQHNIQSHNTEGAESGEVDVFDPAYLRKIGMTEAAIKQIIDRLDKIEAEKEANAKTEQKLRATKQVFDELSSFQEKYPEFKTTRSLEQINQEYKETIKRLGVIAGTDGSAEANYDAMALYLEDEGEKGEALRELAEKNGIRLPDEFDTFSEIAKLKAEASQKIGSDGKPVLSLEDIYLLKKARGEISVELPANSQERNTSRQSEANERLRMKMEGARLRSEHAVDIDPSLSGKPTEADAMTEDELTQIIDGTSDQELRTDPRKLARYNMAAKALGMRPINPLAYR